MTDQERQLLAETEARLSSTGRLLIALDAFMRSSVSNRVGDMTVHLIADRAAWEALTTAVAKETNK